MTSAPIQNIVASTAARLNNIAKEHGWEYQHVLTGTLQN